MKTLSKTNFKSVMLYGGVIVGGLGIFYKFDKIIKYRTAVNNVVTEYCEMALRSDSRILNYCGNNFKIKHYEIVTSDRNSMTIRFQVNGIRGKCKVLAKCEKSTHKYLKSHFDQQIKFSVLSKEEKNMSPFTPINFNDVLIPDKKVIERITTVSEDNEIFNYNIDKFNNGFYNKIEKLSIEPVKDDDEFWRISSLVLISKESMIFNVRPISNKLKNYDLEDTFYKLRSYQDVIGNIIEFKDKYIATLNKKLTNEEFRREINQMKQSNLERRSKSRKGIAILEVFLFIGGFFIVRIFLNKTVLNHPGYSQALKIIQKSPIVASVFGNQPTVLFATGRVLFSKTVKFNLHVQGSKKSGCINFQANDEPDFIQKAIIKLGNNEEIELKKIAFIEENLKVQENKQKTNIVNFSEARWNLNDPIDGEKESKEKNDFEDFEDKKSEKSNQSFFSKIKKVFSKEEKINKL